MELKEFEEQLTELETRVDRLRALYENWFRGYEKTEPRVARKDVERRVYGLRKELPRNTALRFRYHQLYQRYTTLASYWQRTARQIEEGTFRLQLQRFRRKKDREHERVEERASVEGEGDEAAQNEGDDIRSRPLSYELDLDESLNVDDLLNDLEMDAVAKAVDTPGRHSEPPPPMAAKATFGKPKRRASEPPKRGVVPLRSESSRPSRPPPAQDRPGKREPFFDDEHELPTGLHLSLEEPPRNPGKSTATASAPQRFEPPGPPPGFPARSPQLPSTPRNTQIGTRVPLPEQAQLGSVANAPAAPSAPNGRLPRSTLAGAPPVPPPAPGLPSSAGVAGGSLPGRSLPDVPAPPPNIAPSAARPAPSAPEASALRPAPSAPNGAPPARPAVPAPGVAGARPGPPPPPPAAASRPGVPPPRPAPSQSSGTIVGRPPPSSPLAGAAKPSAPNGMHAKSGDLNDQQMRKIYSEYAEARRKNNEGEVRYESLVGSIQKMMPDLQKKHAGKQIDFEIVVKDGRVGLKPKAT
jgi:hypothetical protein